MKTTQCQILMIMNAEEKATQTLREILLSRDFNVHVASRLNEGMNKISECSPDLIICGNELEGKSGFRIFKVLQPLLNQNGIPFILFLKEFRKDDVLIGLELGIDNFILYPFDKESLLGKIEKHILKSKKGKVFDSEQFNFLFETSPVAKFFAENDQIIRVNNAFTELTGIGKDLETLPKIQEVFNFHINETCELDFQKCVNGLKPCCLFKSVPLKTNKNSLVNIHLVYTNYLDKDVFTGEIVPDGNWQPQSTGIKTTGINNTNGENNLSGNKKKIELTFREKQIFELSAKGLAIKQIAGELSISPRTVEKHRANIMEKTQTTNMMESIYYFSNQEN
jgi:DNA-binding NarL/FixJ family response regulator